jgi:hypothetical protein
MNGNKKQNVMKSILTKKVLFLALVAVTVFATGCIKEDLDECYKLTLKVVNHKGDDITALSVVSEAKLFIYDNNSKLLDTRDLNDAFIRGKETIELNYPESSKLHLIARIKQLRVVIVDKELGFRNNAQSRDIITFVVHDL